MKKCCYMKKRKWSVFNLDGITCMCWWKVAVVFCSLWGRLLWSRHLDGSENIFLQRLNVNFESWRISLKTRPQSLQNIFKKYVAIFLINESTSSQINNLQILQLHGKHTKLHRTPDRVLQKEHKLNSLRQLQCTEAWIYSTANQT